MSDFLELAKTVGLPTAGLLVAVVVLWRLVERELARKDARIAELERELKEEQKLHLKDLQTLLAAADRQRASSSAPSST